MTRYRVIYADPPWSYYGDPNKDQAAGKHYSLMTDGELAALPVREWADDPSVLFLWATCPRLDSAVALIESWGFHFRGVPYVWVKTTQDGRVISGQGVRPSITKPTVEMVLAGSTKRRGRPLPLLTEAQGQVVLAPRGGHSEKPPEVRRRIEELYGDVPRLEMFARHEVPGWAAWGNEVGKLGKATMKS